MAALGFLYLFETSTCIYVLADKFQCSYFLILQPMQESTIQQTKINLHIKETHLKVENLPPENF